MLSAVRNLSMAEISIAKDFSPFPGGRYRAFGRYSGEEFRDDLLIPLLKQEEAVSVILDGTQGYGSSFLEEAFGGLVRSGLARDELQQKLRMIARNPEFKAYISEVWSYIDDAERSMNKA